MTLPSLPGRPGASDPDLSDRQRAVFARLVALHGRDARPVSSDRLSRTGGIRQSGASLRSTLAELEGMGLLERSHAAGGRVPTAVGWSYFVRAVVEPAPLPAEVEDLVLERLSQSRHDVERLLQEASRLLASFSRQMGLALAATLDDARLASIELERIGERRVLMVLGLEGLRARSVVLELDTPLEREALAEVAEVLAGELVGGTLREARTRLAADPALARHSAVRIVARAATTGWARGVETPLLTSGMSHIAEQPEFADGARLVPVLRALESGGSFERLMVSGLQGHAGVQVGIGPAAAAALSLVSFPLPGAVHGAVGVQGPMRMDYATTLALVDLVGARVSDLLSA
ncbi:MAG: HrcA family transcriptional regulator [bacterium]